MANMDVVGIEGEQKVPEDATQDSGWFEVKRRSRKQDGDAAKLKSDSYSTQCKQRIDRDGWKKKKGARNIRQLIAASRMPNLPPEDYRIIIRPRGGINVTEHGVDRIYHSIRRAAEIGTMAEEEDNICLNSKQNIIVLSTPSEDRAKKYVSITRLRIGDKEYEASAHRAAPENTSKGVIRGISKEESPEDTRN